MQTYTRKQGARRYGVSVMPSTEAAIIHWPGTNYPDASSAWPPSVQNRTSAPCADPVQVYGRKPAKPAPQHAHFRS
jgi:hypothetical protein